MVYHSSVSTIGRAIRRTPTLVLVLLVNLTICLGGFLLGAVFLI